MVSGEIGIDDFKRMDIRIGTVKGVERVPRTERLYRVLVDLGEGGVRQTVASLVGYYEAEELLGKRVVFLANLRPAKFSGQLSHGMILAAEWGKEVTLLTIDRDAPDGARVT
jgi:methionyl-tRNA synthetase